MISWSSSFASSTPATSLKVTFFCELDDSFALLLPNDSALLPPLCIWRMKKIQKPITSRKGAHEYSSDAHGLTVCFLDVDVDVPLDQLLTSPSYCPGWGRSSGRVVGLRRAGDFLAGDETWEIWPLFTCAMNSLN